MLGEGARTAEHASAYFAAYAHAIEKIGKSAGERKLHDRPGISIKLSALHPRYEAVNRDRVLRELVPSLIESYRSVVGVVNVDIDAHHVKLPINEAIPCGLVINELVSNALKHGFARGRGGSIKVTVQACEDHTVEIAVSNDGHPISDDLDLTQTSTLGFQLVRLLTRQLDGTLDVQRANPTRFSLRFPVEGDT